MEATAINEVEIISDKISKKQLEGLKGNIVKDGNLYKVEDAVGPSERNCFFCRIYWEVDGEHFTSLVPLN